MTVEDLMGALEEHEARLRVVVESSDLRWGIDNVRRRDGEIVLALAPDPADGADAGLIRTRRIATLNDELRRSGAGGRVVVTAGVLGLGLAAVARLVAAIATHEDFGPDSDPHAEHDFGVVELDRQRFFWKIDYYDRSHVAASEDPADPRITARVMTIMLAEEY